MPSAGNRKSQRKYQLIPARLGRLPVSAMCRVLHVSEQRRYRSLRCLKRGLREYKENGESYGVRRTIAWLRLLRNYTKDSQRIYCVCWERRLTIHCQHRPPA